MISIICGVASQILVLGGKIITYSNDIVLTILFFFFTYTLVWLEAWINATNANENGMQLVIIIWSNGLVLKLQVMKWMFISRFQWCKWESFKSFWGSNFYTIWVVLIKSISLPKKCIIDLIYMKLHISFLNIWSLYFALSQKDFVTNSFTHLKLIVLL